MTAASRRGDSLAPSLFPFLAVLLCTMGALVLVLMLLVAGAESSGKEVVKQLDEELQWEQEKIQLIKNGLHEKYEEAKIELEKKRLVLQNYEQHIHELNEELEQLDKTAQQTEEKVDTEQDTQQNRDELREALEKQLAEAKQLLEKKLKDPKGDKPIFAIIPYNGPNGTHRRPIYLECNAKGVVVQPEGVVLNPVDLRPPYGPGNPLDAVLRTIRAEFPATNGAVTSNPYPLLVVRPSGIRHFMMARAAMSGWDDQFGYELISEDLELTFPPSVPKLEQKIVSAIDMARERQAALVMAMPQHYSSNQLDAFGAYGGGSSSSGGFADDSLDFGSGAASGEGTLASASATGSGSGRRGGLSMGPGPAPGGAQQSKNNFAGQGSGPDGQQGANGQLTMAQAATLDPAQVTSRQGLQTQSGGPPNGSGQMSFFGSGGLPDDPLALGSSSSRNRFGGTENVAGGELSMDGGSGSLGEDGGGRAGGSPGPSTYSTTTDGAGGAASSGGGSAGGSLAGGQAGPAGTQGSASSSSPGGSGASAPSGGQIGGAIPSGGASGSPSVDANADPSQAGGISSLNMNFSKNPGEAAKPIAQSRGRDWAWRDGNRSQTAVIRSIRLQCFVDRWVLLPDRGSKAAPTIINLDGTLVQRAEKLAEAVTSRVEGWGVAVAGGHWAPVLHVEVASDAEWRFQQLQRLMEGSGIDVVRKATIAPQLRF